MRSVLVLILSGMLVACASMTPTPMPTPTTTTIPAPNRTAEKLVGVLDSLQVESHWLPNVSVNWKTGEPTGKTTTSNTTHCSAFVAAAALKLGVYILRPPEHSTVLLANAQNDWLNKDSATQGWERVANSVEAQTRANLGWLVVASYKNPDPQKHGHIAIVRPDSKSAADALADGPQIIQAGSTNYNSTTLQIGFKGHPTALKKNQIQFFAHRLDF
jgi:hypothetical protein